MRLNCFRFRFMQKAMEDAIIQNRIYEIRGIKVMFDFDLAELYEVGTKVLNQAVKRNISRFPEDFMFRLNTQEWNNNWSQIVTSSRKHRGKSYLPYVFNEHGVTMMASVLRSDRAIQMNIAIVRVFKSLGSWLTNRNKNHGFFPPTPPRLEPWLETLRFFVTHRNYNPQPETS